jgi:CheY-like chemotaxis protein
MVQKKILVVGYHVYQREIMQRLVDLLGYAVKSAESAEEALILLEEESFPLILTELILPDMDGPVLCEQIKAVGLESLIYAVSEHAKLYESERLERVGFDGLICKPVRIEILRQTIEGAFNRINRSLLIRWVRQKPLTPTHISQKSKSFGKYLKQASPKRRQ